MIYTCCLRVAGNLGILVVSFLVASAFAVQNSYIDGAIVGVQKKANTRVLYYIVNTPVTRDDPYYEVQVKLKDTLYTAQYTPRHADDTFPEEYRPETAVQARVEKRHLYVKRAGGDDLDLVIVKRPERVKGTTEPSPAKQ